MLRYICTLLLVIAAAVGFPQGAQTQQNSPRVVGQQATAARLQFQCPKKDGFYPDPVQCDKYWECYDGIAEEKLCADGLVFPTFGNPRHERCDFPFNIDCDNRLELQAPQSTINCPRSNGFYAHQDPTICDVFYQCVHGEATETKCPGGLHFDEYAGTCAWPDSSYRTGCGETIEVLPDGFRCTNRTIQEVNGLSLVHPRYAHPTDCQLFYVCLNGKFPRQSGCPVGTVYNEISMACDEPANVPGCERWYEPLDYYDETLPAKDTKPERPQQLQG